MDNTYMVNDNESSSDEDLLLILHLRQQKKKIKGYFKVIDAVLTE